MLGLLLPILGGAVAGAVAGGLLAWWLLRRQTPGGQEPSTPIDPWVSAEIDRAAVRFATDNGRPEAAGLIADKLHLLHHLGQRRQGRPR